MKTTAEKLDILTGLIARKETITFPMDCMPDIIKIHPPILSDVLVWLEKNKFDYVVAKWWIITIATSIIDRIKLERDLTKPYLSEQKPETIDWFFEVSLLIKS